MAAFIIQRAIVVTAVVFAVVVGYPAERDSNPLIRPKRSDDTSPLLATVERLAQRVAQLEAQGQVVGHDMGVMRQDIDAASGQMMGFTVRTKQGDVQGLGLRQVVRFDDVIFNSGNGYNPDTGIFTASLPGTYVFFLQTMHHNNDDTRIVLDVMKNGVFLTLAHAGYSTDENGSTLAVTHLNQGDTIRVEVETGTMFWGGPYSTFSGFRVSPK